MTAPDDPRAHYVGPAAALRDARAIQQLAVASLPAELGEPDPVFFAVAVTLSQTIDALKDVLDALGSAKRVTGTDAPAWDLNPGALHRLISDALCNAGETESERMHYTRQEEDHRDHP